MDLNALKKDLPKVSELAKMLCTSRQQVYHLYNGKADLKVKDLLIMLKLLNISFDEFKRKVGVTNE